LKDSETLFQTRVIYEAAQEARSNEHTAQTSSSRDNPKPITDICNHKSSNQPSSSNNNPTYTPFALSEPVPSTLFQHEPVICAKSGKYTHPNPKENAPAYQPIFLQGSHLLSDQSTEVPLSQEIQDHEMVDAFNMEEDDRSSE
jgi:hypothetical protein